MIKELRQEFYFGEDSPLICDEKGDYTKPDVFRRRYHRLLEGAGILPIKAQKVHRRRQRKRRPQKCGRLDIFLKP